MVIDGGRDHTRPPYNTHATNQRTKTVTHDPDRNEMLAFLAGCYPADSDDFDREQAMYWFAANWHGGQTSNLYSVLSTSPYKPGMMESGPEPDSMAAYLYSELEAEFGQ